MVRKLTYFLLGIAVLVAFQNCGRHQETITRTPNAVSSFSGNGIANSTNVMVEGIVEEAIVEEAEEPIEEVIVEVEQQQEQQQEQLPVLPDVCMYLEDTKSEDLQLEAKLSKRPNLKLALEDYKNGVPGAEANLQAILQAKPKHRMLVEHYLQRLAQHEECEELKLQQQVPDPPIEEEDEMTESEAEEFAIA